MGLGGAKLSYIVQVGLYVEPLPRKGVLIQKWKKMEDHRLVTDVATSSRHLTGRMPGVTILDRQSV